MYIIIIFVKRWRCPRPWWFMSTIFNKMIRAITIKTTLNNRRRFWSSRTVFNKMIMAATGITAFGTVSVSVIPRTVTLTRRVFGRVMTMTWRMRRSPWLTVTMLPVPIVRTFRTRWVATGRIMIRRFKNTTRNMFIRRVSVIFIIVMRPAAGKVPISIMRRTLQAAVTRRITLRFWIRNSFVPVKGRRSWIIITRTGVTGYIIMWPATRGSPVPVKGRSRRVTVRIIRVITA